MKLTLSSVIVAVVFSSAFSLAAGKLETTPQILWQLKQDATMVGYYDGLHLIDDSLTDNNEQKLSKAERAKNNADRAKLNAAIESILVSAEFNMECRLALREVVQDARTADFIRTASTAANSVKANKLAQDTLKLAKAIFENGRTAGQAEYRDQNALNNCPK